MQDQFAWQLFVTPGLGDNTYVVESDGELAIVDPQRDVWRFLSGDSEKRKMHYVLETHVHNDYVSGMIEMRNQTGAEIVAAARGGYEFPHRGVAEGDEVRIGAVRLVAMETPGHTPEHISWLLYEDGNNAPVAIFTGGSLLVGSAGRTDLLGTARAEELTRQQYDTLQRLSTLPRSIQVFPTHGAGSFCTSGGKSQQRVSTLDQELHQNAFLKLRKESDFFKEVLKPRPIPAYYSHIASINRKGPKPLGRLPLAPAVTAPDISSHMHLGGWVIDCRDRKDFARAHIPGSINIELNESFATYAGWIVPFAAPLMLVLLPPFYEAAADAITQLIRIGYDDIRGFLANGFESWEEIGAPIRSYPTGNVEELCRDLQQGKNRLIDVRQEEEWEEGHIRGTIHLFIGDLPAKIDSISKNEQYWVGCASGFRSAIAASYLDRRGISVRLLSEKGIADVIESCPSTAA